VSTTNGIAKLWKPVVNVCDLSEGERFWSALTGLSPTGTHGDENGDQYSVLDDLDGGGDASRLLLQLVPRDQAFGSVGPTSTSEWTTWPLPYA
jgi:hypothetical protein